MVRTFLKVSHASRHEGPVDETHCGSWEQYSALYCVTANSVSSRYKISAHKDDITRRTIVLFSKITDYNTLKMKNIFSELCLDWTLRPTNMKMETFLQFQSVTLTTFCLKWCSTYVWWAESCRKLFSVVKKCTRLDRNINLKKSSMKSKMRYLRQDY